MHAIRSLAWTSARHWRAFVHAVGGALMLESEGAAVSVNGEYDEAGTGWGVLAALRIEAFSARILLH